MPNNQKIDFEKRRELILESVSPLFAEKGLGVTTKELALAAGVSEALLYKHFKSKEEIFDEVKVRCCKFVHSIAEKVLEEVNLAERLAVSMVLAAYSILIGFEKDVLPKEEVHRLILQSLISKGEFAEQMFSNFGRWVQIMSNDIEEARKAQILESNSLTSEESLWMVHHFLLGFAATRLPENRLDVFNLNSEDLFQKAAVQALIMIGRSHQKAKEDIEKAIIKFNRIKGESNV